MQRICKTEGNKEKREKREKLRNYDENMMKIRYRRIHKEKKRNAREGKMIKI